ncbi:amino acid ABC transporter/signal transduction system periplasmic protein [Alteromonas macleodii str. 'Black Sea 11']|uniref:amino acid ABC transporter substrate-binding protein n=1 Tax=Alteromonas abrolhosensis TaxID=1892904 RepID=UPI000286EBD3|nr:amino acid ABC transporter/signal transduction system periplasmic protein [Alteromonas macleodii str. 'Black Sea 11']NKW88191.1 amino acid ABC transporter substrate-binding protein [Alteromonadaceae bacterium A_SAG4]NKX35987.1 amino acid ABC transporter substrate-binding protein [Alteromonadaceae bacterium A_SAG3]NKX69758.1 amino acid ABC transporter substrate-binding protein [Alteromonadaceae bacterium A_SAG7]
MHSFNLLKKAVIAAFALCSFVVTMAEAATWTITYPRPIDDSDARAQYPIALLKLALDKTGVNYELRPSDRILLTGKAMRQLRENREVNVVWSMTDSQREKELTPIRIPIAKGLIGLRVFVINQNKKAKFDNVLSLTDMRKLVPIQGEEWPDTKILQANGFNVFTVPEFREAYDMIKQGKGDFFPRSVMEVDAELEAEGRRNNFYLEPSMALYYPTAMYYFVSGSNKTLANLIETGLNRAIDDGSFDALFESTYAPILASLGVNERKIFTLENPLLPIETPLTNSALWYKPKTEASKE